MLSIWVRVWVWVFFKSFANFELDNSKYNKKNLIFGYGFEYKFRKTRKKIKIDTQIHTQKLKFFFEFKLSNSKFAKDLQNTQTQNPNTQKIENPNPDLNLWVFWVNLSGSS